MSDNAITFYDIPSKNDILWSPNTWKVRYILNYKRIPYQTVMLEYPDIEPTMKKVGIAPTNTKPDGSPLYTLPAIWDPTTQSGISNSPLIAQYLDETYPDKPLVFPPGTRTVQEPWNDMIYWPMFTPLLPFLRPKTTWILNQPSADYYRKYKSAIKMEDLYPSGEQKVIEWKKVEAAFDKLSGWFGKEDGLIMGRGSGTPVPTFADFALGAYLMWLKAIFGQQSEEWEDIAVKWNSGRWGRFLKMLEKYEQF